MNLPIAQKAEHRYRIDKFRVPPAARNEFMHNVQMTHALLQAQPGFVQDLLLEQIEATGAVSVITIVVWENATALAAARQAISAHRAATGFNPQELLARLKIEADLGVYTLVDPENRNLS